MSADLYLGVLTRSVDVLSALARQPPDALSRAVPACPDWTLDELLGHLGSVERWAAAVVRSGRFVQEQAPPATGGAGWFLDGAASFLEAMTDLDPGTECWTFGPPPRMAGFWLRRQAHEHAIHVVDACQARGEDLPALSEEFMLDGVDEVLTMFTPRQLRLHRMPLPELAVTFRVPGTDGWTLGPGPAVATITAALPDMYLGLWGRSDLADTAVIEGDTGAARVVLRGPLTP